MSQKQKPYVDAIELLTDVALLLLNRNNERLCSDGGLTIAEMSDILGRPVTLVRKAVCELAAMNQKDGKGGFYLEPQCEDEQEQDEVYEILTSYANVREKHFKNGSLDNIKLAANLNGYRDLYVMFNSKDYDSLRKFLKEKHFSEDIMHMEAEEFYRTIPNYTDYSKRDTDMERIVLSAIKDDRDINVFYENKYNGKSFETTIKPLKLVRYNFYGVTYIVTIYNGEIQPFRMDYIKRVSIAQASKIKLEDLKPLDSLPYIWGMDVKSGEGDVVLKVYNHNYGKVIDKVERDLRYYFNEAGYTMERNEAGDAIIKGHVIGKNYFLNWVRTYGASMVVLEPREWGQEIILGAKNKLKKYEDE